MPSPKIPSARVLQNRAARVVLNKAALDAVVVGMADGLLEMGEAILADAVAHAPRDPEAAAKRGVPMMADTGHVVVLGLGKKVGGDGDKPSRVKAPKDQAIVIVYFSSPLAHFAELGTVKERARPFLLPAFGRGLPGASRFVLPSIAARVRAVPG